MIRVGAAGIKLRGKSYLLTTGCHDKSTFFPSETSKSYTVYNVLSKKDNKIYQFKGLKNKQEIIVFKAVENE